jgi:hypothetical protein
VAEPDHLVLTADLVASRDVPDRAALQERLLALLDTLNEQHAAMAEVPLSITAGDEFQGVFVPGGGIVALADDVQRELHPVRARIGIGIGSIATPLRDRSQEMDGEAFLFARQALDAARRPSPDAWLWFRTADESFDLAANAIALLLGIVKSRWKPLHWRRAHLRDQGWSVERIAASEGIRQESVSNCLRTMAYEPAREAQERLAKHLERRWT